MAPSAYLAALLLVGLSCTAAQIETMPVASDTIFTQTPNQPLAVGLADTIDLVTPQDYAGPYNASFYSQSSNAGFSVRFGEIPMTRDSWIRVDACLDSSCSFRELVGYGMPNTTLFTQAVFVKVSMQFGAVVDKNFFPIFLNAGAAACSVPLNSTCVAKYAPLYGCHEQYGVFGGETPMYFYPMLDTQDSCYQNVVLETCIQDVCNDCRNQCTAQTTALNAIRAGVPNVVVPAVNPECKAACDKQNYPFHYCAPSCINNMLNDQTCHPECDNAMCGSDGGDCIEGRLLPGLTRVYPGGFYRQIIDTYDADGDMFLSFQEYKAYANVPDAELAAADNNRDGMLDAFELRDLEGGFSHYLIDNVLDDLVMMDKASLFFASLIVKTYDMNLDGELDESESVVLSKDQFDTVNSRGLFPRDANPVDDISIDDLAHILFGIYVSLSGRTLSDPPFDNQKATDAVVTTLDRDMDGALSAKEALFFGLSLQLFDAIDADGNKNLTARELLDMQTEQMAAGCAGTVLLTDRESEVKTKAPLAGSSERKCYFAMIPDWFYPTGAMSMVQNPPMTTTVATGNPSRRLLAMGGQSAASSKAAKSVVMSRKSGPVPNHHLLSAKTAQKVPHVNHGRRLLQTTGQATQTTGGSGSTLDMGMAFNVTSDTMPWIVQVKAQVDGMWTHACLGALIHPEFVLVPGQCAADMQQPLHVIFEDGMIVPKLTVYDDPFTNARGNISLALIQLRTSQDTRPTVQLHDGAGLDLSECNQPLIAVGVSPGYTPEYNNTGSFPTMVKQAVQIVDNKDCMDSHAVVNRISAVSPTTVCAEARNMTPKVCFYPTDDSLLLAPDPEDPSQYVVVGVRAQDGSQTPCSDTTLPSIYNHVAGSLTWILSLPALRSKFPAQLLSVKVEDLHITDGMEVTVESSSGAIAGDIKTKCSRGGKYFDDGLGTLLVSITSPASVGYFDSDIKLEFNVSGCGDADIPMGMPGANDMQCEMLVGCTLETIPGPGHRDPPVHTCRAPQCEFKGDWKNVTKDLQAYGKAFTGGLGGESEVNGVAEYRQWMCARDWDVDEQLACNVGPGELSCFRFEEKADVFEPFGRNAHKKIVSAQKAMQGIQKEKRGLTVI